MNCCSGFKTRNFRMVWKEYTTKLRTSSSASMFSKTHQPCGDKSSVRFIRKQTIAGWSLAIQSPLARTAGGDHQQSAHDAKIFQELSLHATSARALQSPEIV